MIKTHFNLRKLFSFLPVFLFAQILLAQSIDLGQDKENRFRYLEAKAKFGAFLKNNNSLAENGLLDNGYGAVTLKYGWQTTEKDEWAKVLGFPSFGVGIYSGFMSDAEVFGNPNAFFGFVKFPLTNIYSRTELYLEPSFGLTYNLNAYDKEKNPLNDAIGARVAVYFNLNLGATYKWTRELDLLYGLDFTHFSNGSTYKPNSGLNLYGINLGIRYNYNGTQLRENKDIYSNNVLDARYKRPQRDYVTHNLRQAINIFTAVGLAQNDEMLLSNSLRGVFSGVLDYEIKFNEMHGANAGVDFLFDNRLYHLDLSKRWMYGVHAGYTFSFFRFDTVFQFGTYIGSDNGKGSFFMRPGLRYHINDFLFTQVSLKTLDGGAADYIEYGIGFKPFKW